MNIKDDRTENVSKLRARAEQIVQRKIVPWPKDFETLSSEEIQHLIHELRVFQIELQMQNDELQRMHVELEATRARYFDLYNVAPIGYFIISRDGLILEVNLAAVNLLDSARAALVKKPITRFILKEDLYIYYQHRRQLWVTGTVDACELRMVKNDGTTFWVRLAATVTRDRSTCSGRYTGGAPLSRIVLSEIGDCE